MAWYVDKGLATLIRQWKAKHPGATVGTIGDQAHQGEYSEHNPEADGSVDAGDFMVGNGVTNADLQWLASTLSEHRDKRLLYVIWKQQIYSNNGGNATWMWREYDGEYHDHVHVSVNDSYESDGSEWNLGDSDMELTDQIYGGGTPSTSWTNRFKEADDTVRNAMAFAAFYAYDGAKAQAAILAKLDEIATLLKTKK